MQSKHDRKTTTSRLQLIDAKWHFVRFRFTVRFIEMWKYSQIVCEKNATKAVIQTITRINFVYFLLIRFRSSMIRFMNNTFLTNRFNQLMRFIIIFFLNWCKKFIIKILYMSIFDKSHAKFFISCIHVELFEFNFLFFCRWICVFMLIFIRFSYFFVRISRSFEDTWHEKHWMFCLTFVIIICFE